MWVIWIIDDQCTAKAIAVLGPYTADYLRFQLGKSKPTMMRMVPKRSRLVWDAELVQERVARNDRALIDSDWTVCVVSPFLE